MIEPSNKLRGPSLITERQENNEIFYNEVFVDAEEILPISRIPEKDTSQSKVIDEPKTRKNLPAPMSSKSKVSLWAVLKNLIGIINLGQDLTHFTLPAYFNEPLSIIQKTCECMENDFLLDKAANEKSSLKRLAYVMAFNIGQFNTVVGRTKKPFNPLLGETYEYCTNSFKVVGEQVTHHPPVSAIHAENENYILEADTQLNTQFWGTCLEISSIGFMRVYLKKTKENFRLKRPIVSIHNLIIGKLYIDLRGEAVVENLDNKEYASIKCYLKGWKEDNYGKFDGAVYDNKKIKKLEIFGKWCDKIFLKDLEVNDTFPIWQRFPNPENWEENYCFTFSTIQLNYLTQELKKKLPPTDSRFRPDQRLVEEGDYIKSQQEKTRIEQKQRAKRKEMEEKHLKHKPLYFDEIYNSDIKCLEYHFNYQYWKDKENNDWSKCPDIF